LNDAAYAYADVALAGAASAPFHPYAFTDWANAGAASTAAKATAAISVFMVCLHQTHFTMSGVAHLPSSSVWAEKLLPSIKSRIRARGISRCNTASGVARERAIPADGAESDRFS
jgi:hypothetical protein